MKTKSLILCFCFLFFSSVLLFAAEPNILSIDSVSIKMLHIFIQADVNDVRFDNIWVFQNRQRGEPWQVEVNLPDQAILLDFNEPNEAEFLKDSLSLRKKMAPNSVIGYMDFSFVLPNRNGLCRTSIEPSYRVNSIIVSVSGAATQLKSNLLKFNRTMVSRSRFSGVYTADNLPAGTKINMNLSRLPRESNKLPQVICVIGLSLIIIAALFTIYYSRLTKAGREPHE
jgi:hypothetical protein